ncbi:uncharacterized protein LOC119730207 [Patiria miniata]|uniref:BEN domain-containing protein n=1 Tax=Patiria miniata TaxID=46514 RepID=A0A914A539_PATMI|nr:uncharacterized protein LOC119730207 [Patiria miniata]XP_038058924.1 uncharacterized protein LOC119730207 [Patiria miniata]XP_038058925.1 uncharacterized protein LOC119730207 [Patiria miniata]
MDRQMHVSIAEQGCKKTPTSAKPRRTSYYKKKGRQGRRTKLTGSLLGAITKIINETEIMSISHLSQELFARGHSLSRSTVFRAMEVLGLQMDRDRKVWCAGPARTQAGRDPARGTKHDANMSIDEGYTKLHTNSTSANTGSFSGTSEDTLTLTASNYNYPQQRGYSSSNFQYTNDHVSLFDTEISENGGLYIETQSQNRQTKRGMDDSLNLVLQDFDLDQCTGRQGSALLADEWTDAAKDQDGLRPVNVTSSTFLQRRGRKRKSDCPAKFGAFHNRKETCVDTTCWPSTAPAAASNGHADGKLKGSSSAESQAPRTLPISVNLPADNPWIHVPPKTSVKAKESSTPSPGVYDYGIKDQERPQRLHQQEKQAGKMRTEKLPTGFKSRAESPVLPRTLTQSSLRDSLISEPEACDNGTSVSGKIERRNKSNGAAPKFRRVALDHEVAGFVEWDDSKFVLRDRRLIGTTLKDDHVPVTSFNLQGRGTDPPLRKSTPQSQRRQQSISPQLSPDAQKEVMHKDAGHQLQLQSSAANGGLNLSSKSQQAKAGASKWSEQHLGRQSRKAGQLLAGDENKPMVNSTMPGLRRISPDKSMRRETDPQTARLHALTSSLAAKTSRISEASSQDLEINRRRATDGKYSDKLSPDLYSNNANHELSVDRNHTIGSRADNEPRVTQTRQKAFSKSSLPSANKHGASACPQHESIQSSQNACGTVNAPASSDMNCFSMFLPELKSWMQDVSNRLNSMENQLQYLTQIITQPSGATEEADEKLSDEEETGDREAEETDEEDAGKAEDEEGVEEEEEGSQTWDTSLPPINTPDSNDMINKLLSDERWNSFSPYVGGTRLAIRLARDCIFGSKILSKSTVTGRNGMKPLQRDGVKKIKDCLMQIYGPKCSEVECEILWKMARESLSQLCKRTRRQFAIEANDNEMDEQA